jgi:hypothetical protein
VAIDVSDDAIGPDASPTQSRQNMWVPHYDMCTPTLNITLALQVMMTYIPLRLNHPNTWIIRFILILGMTTLVSCLYHSRTPNYTTFIRNCHI